MNAKTFDARKYAKEIEDQGYTIVPDTLSEVQIRDATTAMLEVYEREREVSETVETQTEHALSVHHLFAKHRYFEEFYLNDKVNAVVRLVLGDDMVLTETHARSILPSGGREERYGFQVHVDRVPYWSDRDHENWDT